MSADQSPSAGKTNVSAMDTLPLEWTRVTRKRSRGVSQQVEEDGNCEDPDCLSASCRRRGWRQVPAPSSANSIIAETRVTPKKRNLSGTAIFLLHETNPAWFQGYFFPSSGGGQKKPLGLLAVQKDVDECLQCAAGGYRVIDLTVLLYNSNHKRQQQVFTDVEWTGGDMINLSSTTPLKDEPIQNLTQNDSSECFVWMQADKIETGDKALPAARGIFDGLLRKLLSKTTEEEILECFPDLCIVRGTMRMEILSEYLDDSTTVSAGKEQTLDSLFDD